MSVHVLAVPLQPATRFVDQFTGKEYRCRARKLFWGRCCGKRRWAKYVKVQVYYDGIYAFCAGGHGCKSK